MSNVAVILHQIREQHNIETFLGCVSQSLDYHQQTGSFLKNSSLILDSVKIFDIGEYHKSVGLVFLQECRRRHKHKCGQ